MTEKLRGADVKLLVVSDGSLNVLALGNLLQLPQRKDSADLPDNRAERT